MWVAGFPHELPRSQQVCQSGRTIWILGSTKFAKKPFRGVQTALSKLLWSKWPTSGCQRGPRSYTWSSTCEGCTSKPLSDYASKHRLKRSGIVKNGSVVMVSTITHSSSKQISHQGNNFECIRWNLFPMAQAACEDALSHHTNQQLFECFICTYVLHSYQFQGFVVLLNHHQISSNFLHHQVVQCWRGLDSLKEKICPEVRRYEAPGSFNNNLNNPLWMLYFKGGGDGIGRVGPLAFNS